MSSHWGGSPTNLILAFSHISPRYFCRGPLRGARPIDPPTQPRVSSRNVVCGKNRAEKGPRQRHKPRPRHSQLARETRKNVAQASPREGGTIYIAGQNVRGMRRMYIVSPFVLFYDSKVCRWNPKVLDHLRRTLRLCIKQPGVPTIGSLVHRSFLKRSEQKQRDREPRCRAPSLVVGEY